jgi:hypothetical protein
LKSVVHVWFGAVIGARAAVTWAWRFRRCRGATNPRALSSAQTVDRLGHLAAASSRAATARSFRAPQRGWRVRSATSIATSVGSVADGLCAGRRG